MPKPSKDDLASIASLEEFVRGAREASALKAALELEIFTRVSEGHRSLPALIHVTGLNERGLRLLVDALANINLLAKTPFEYSLTPTSEAFLVKGKPTYYGDALLTQLAWEARGQVARSVRSGKPVSAVLADAEKRTALGGSTSDWPEWQSVVQEFAPIWEELGLSEDGTGRTQALGLSAEAGLRMVPLAQRTKKIRVVVVDGPTALASLKEILQGLHLQDRIEFIEADSTDVALPANEFDLTFVDSITALRSMEQNIGLLHRAYEAIKVGGRIILRAPMTDDERKGPDLIPSSGLDVLIATTEGDIYTATEYRGMLEAAGFFEVKPVGERPGILTARRIPPPPPPPPAPTVAPDFIPPPETRP